VPGVAFTKALVPLPFNKLVVKVVPPFPPLCTGKVPDEILLAFNEVN